MTDELSMSDFSHLPTITNSLDPVECARIVMRTKQAHMVIDKDTGKEIVVLDYFSASAITAVDKALTTQQARDKLRGMDIVKAALTCLKLAERHKT